MKASEAGLKKPNNPRLPLYDIGPVVRTLRKKFGSYCLLNSVAEASRVR